MSIRYEALEYHADGSLAPCRMELDGTAEEGWRVERNGARWLEVGPGYESLAVLGCGVCSTDLARRFLPFRLPQITGHELLATRGGGERLVVEINASHAARGIASDCPFCRCGLERHCPDRLVLGIHDLPGGFGPRVLAPIHAVHDVPREVPDRTALLVEPFAAAWNAVTTIAPRAGDTVAVLGPRRLGMLVIAALRAWRTMHGSALGILAITRRRELAELARALGADEVIVGADGDEAIPSALADVVVDTTGNPRALELALRLARREVHLKSTHGQPAGGLAHPTELVVDEVSLRPLARDTASDLSGHRVVWLAGGRPPRWRT